MELIETLRDVVGTDNVLTGDDVRCRAVGWAGHSPCQARAIVRPADTQQVSEVLAACHAAGQPVAPMGGLTGLVSDAVIASSEAQRESLRALRDDVESLFRLGMPVTFDISLPVAEMEACVDEVPARQGSVSAEHGIGLEKQPWRALSRSPAELELMHRLKAALDPSNILKPGRVLPT